MNSTGIHLTALRHHQQPEPLLLWSILIIGAAPREGRRCCWCLSLDDDAAAAAVAAPSLAARCSSDFHFRVVASSCQGDGAAPRSGAPTENERATAAASSSHAAAAPVLLSLFRSRRVSLPATCTLALSFSLCPCHAAFFSGDSSRLAPLAAQLTRTHGKTELRRRARGVATWDVYVCTSGRGERGFSGHRYIYI